MKKAVILLTAGLLAVSMTGCIKTERTGVAMDPVFQQQSDKIDFVELHNEVVETFREDGAGPYIFITDLDISGNNDDRSVGVVATAFDTASKEDAEHFASAALKRIGDCASSQNSKYELGDAKKFGTFFNDYKLRLRIYPESEKDNDEKALLVLDIPAGSEIPLDPDNESYEESWEEYMEIYQSNIVYNANGEIKWNGVEEAAKGK